jgi:hypothetical protein
MSESSASVVAVDDIGAAKRVERGRFFVWMSGILLATVLIGFSPTFYLRSYFESPELPAHLYVHGTVLTMWFALLFVQTSMVVADRVAWHRRLGWIGAAVAAAVVGTGALTNFRSIERAAEQLSSSLPQLTQSEQVARFAAGFYGFAAQLVVFTVLVVVAVLMRYGPIVHKRLMLVASINIVGAAAFRWSFALASVGVPPAIAFPVGALVGVVGPWLLLVAVIVYDRRTLRRVQPVTLWSTLGAALLPLLARQLGTIDIAVGWIDRLMYGGT